ncbi:MAG: HEAT repeat domain-containing protein [Spirochaetota bacterium]
MSFEEKLIAALKHPIPETMTMAIIVLGKIKSKRSVQPLIERFNTIDDPYIKREIVKTLFYIGTPESLSFVKSMLHNNNVIIKNEARNLLKTS